MPAFATVVLLVVMGNCDMVVTAVVFVLFVFAVTIGERHVAVIVPFVVMRVGNTIVRVVVV